APEVFRKHHTSLRAKRSLVPRFSRWGVFGDGGNNRTKEMRIMTEQENPSIATDAETTNAETANAETTDAEKRADFEVPEQGAASPVADTAALAGERAKAEASGELKMEPRDPRNP